MTTLGKTIDHHVEKWSHDQTIILLSTIKLFSDSMFKKGLKAPDFDAVMHYIKENKTPLNRSQKQCLDRWLSLLRSFLVIVQTKNVDDRQTALRSFPYYSVLQDILKKAMNANENYRNNSKLSIANKRVSEPLKTQSLVDTVTPSSTKRDSVPVQKKLKLETTNNDGESSKNGINSDLNKTVTSQDGISLCPTSSDGNQFVYRIIEKEDGNEKEGEDPSNSENSMSSDDLNTEYCYQNNESNADELKIEYLKLKRDYVRIKIKNEEEKMHIIRKLFILEERKTNILQTISKTGHK